MVYFKISDRKPTLCLYYNHRCSSRKWQHAIFFVWWIDTVIRLRCSIFLINFFYFINICLEHNLYWFCWYHSKEGIILCPGTKVISTIRLFLFFIYIKSLHESHLSLSTLFLILLFKHPVWKRLSTSAATIIAPVISDKYKSLFFLSYCYTYTIKVLHIFSWSLLFNQLFFENNIYCFSLHCSKEGKFMFCFGEKCVYDSTVYIFYTR